VIYGALLSIGWGSMAGKNVTRVDLCGAVYDKVRLSRLEAMSLVEAVLDQITGTLVKGEKTSNLRRSVRSSCARRGNAWAET